MRKLIKGIIDFRNTKLNDYLPIYEKLVKGQTPDSLFIACSDSRVAANAFASTDPGDLFVVRNVGNCIPCCNDHGVSTADESEAAAIEFALANLNVKNIIVCGHSECGAINALINGREKVPFPNLKSWLRHADKAILPENLNLITKGPNEIHNKISQVNVLVQLENLKSYPIVKEKLARGEIELHGWWFDLASVSVYYYNQYQKEFILIDEEHGKELLEKIK